MRHLAANLAVTQDFCAPFSVNLSVSLPVSDGVELSGFKGKVNTFLLA